MFFVDEGVVKLTDGQHFVCKLSDIPRAIQELGLLSTQQPSEEKVNLSLFTPEGINRYFEADPNHFVPQEQWDEDAEQDWENVPDKELFSRYAKHAESYCWGCRDQGQDPTYNGFRRWLTLLRDME